MLKLKPVNSTYAQNDTIQLTPVFNTNNDFVLEDNIVSIKKAGYVEMDGYVTIVPTTAGAISVNILVNGNDFATITDYCGTADPITIPLYDLFRVIPANLINGYAKVQLQAGTASTISGGVVTFKYIR